MTTIRSEARLQQSLAEVSRALESADRQAFEESIQYEEDLFAGPWDSARNRWPWLAVNLVTAFVASRSSGVSKA